MQAGTMRKFVAGTMIAGVSALGVGGLGVATASAEASAPTAAPDSGTCARRLVSLRADWAALQGRIDVLQRARNVALDHHRWDAAASIERQIIELQAKQFAVHLQIQVLEARCR